MTSWRRASVTHLNHSRTGYLEATVRVSAAPDGAAALQVGSEFTAVAYPQITGPVERGDDVVVNVDALLLQLGTGGVGYVAANVSRLPADRARAGHLVKARYTPTQVTVQGADEQDSPHHGRLREADSVDRMPVVAADLHSALPAIIAGVRHRDTQARVAYIMSDGGALPVAFSRTVATLRDRGWLAATISVGQCFGGDIEAVNVHSGLLAAKHVAGADVAIISQGPGNLGTGTRWGFSGTAVGEAVNAAGVLGGQAVAALRMSLADPRARHRGISHHSMTALGRVALAGCDIAVPNVALPDSMAETVAGQLAELMAVASLHRRVDVAAADIEAALTLCTAAGISLVTMGRSSTEDPLPFQAAAAAGIRSADLAG